MALACSRAVKRPNTMRQTAHLFWECTTPRILRVGRRTQVVHCLPPQVTNPKPQRWGSRGLVSIQDLQVLCRGTQQMALLYEENRPWKSHGKRSFHTGEIKFCGDIKPEPPNRHDRSGNHHRKRWNPGFRHPNPGLVLGF